MKWFAWLRLPAEVSEHERRYLARLHRLTLAFFFAHVPVLALVGVLNRTGGLRAAVLTALVSLGPVLATRAFTNPRHVGRVMAVAAMSLAGLLVHFGQGPMQIEMHFYFFVLLALLIVFADPLAIVIGAVTVAVHHSVLWALYPSAVFNYEASAWSVVVHAVFVLLEAGAACFAARTVFDNAHGLEAKVLARTDDLGRRTEDLKVILDNMGQGFFAFDTSGVLLDDHSAIIETWLGPPPASRKVTDWLAARAPAAAMHVELALDTIREGILTPALVLAQMPERVLVRGWTFSMKYRATSRGIVAVVSDVTKAEEAAQLEAARAGTLRVVEQLLRDREGFLDFFADAERLTAVAFDPWADTIERRRAIHTLRGICPLYGMEAIANVCAQIEDGSDPDSPIDEEDVARLRIIWFEAEANVWRLAGTVSAERIRLTTAEHALLLHLVGGDASRERIAAAINDLVLDSVEERLTRIADQARQLAVHVGRAPLDVTVDTSPIRVSREGWDAIWSAMVHVVRNAVDHGLETPEERRAAHKSERAKLTLKARYEGDDVYLEITDDGRGIDWARVAARAAERGLPHDSRNDLHEALFADGLSTKAEANSLSGRGIGMGAVRAACHAQGGRVLVESERGKGTRVLLLVPRKIEEPSAAPRTTLRPVSLAG